ncbi:hypothetical protein GCM10027615_77390 [Plantactinospora veratri]
MRRHDQGTAAALDPRVVGERAEHRDPAQRARVERQQAAVVAGQHEGADRHRVRQGGAVRRARPVGRGHRRGYAVEQPDPPGEPEHPAYLVVHLRLGDRAGPDGGDQRGAPRVAGGRHHHVESGVRGRLGAPRRRPVGDHDPVEAPLPLEQVPEQAGVLGHGVPVDPVVRGHHRPDPGGDDPFERSEIELPECPLGDPDVHGHPFRLRVVGDQVLDRGPDAEILHAGDVADADLGTEQRILRIALEVPAAERAAVQVDGGGEEQVDLIAPALGPEHPARLPGQLRIPGGGQRGRAGQGDRRVVRGPADAAYPDRTVRHHQRAEPDLGYGRQGPEVLAGEEPDLGLQVERGERPFEYRLRRVGHRVRAAGRHSAGRHSAGRHSAGRHSVGLRRVPPIHRHRRAPSTGRISIILPVLAADRRPTTSVRFRTTPDDAAGARVDGPAAAVRCAGRRRR